MSRIVCVCVGVPLDDLLQNSVDVCTLMLILNARNVFPFHSYFLPGKATVGHLMPAEPNENSITLERLTCLEPDER